eukprot:Rhum_TRINITY_DN14407_c8_g1::Rhum_TRINITY_DN14407_c8_g1_i1::g.88770::m.88770
MIVRDQITRHLFFFFFLKLLLSPPPPPPPHINLQRSLSLLRADFACPIPHLHHEFLAPTTPSTLPGQSTLSFTVSPTPPPPSLLHPHYPSSPCARVQASLGGACYTFLFPCTNKKKLFIHFVFFWHYIFLQFFYCSLFFFSSAFDSRTTTTTHTQPPATKQKVRIICRSHVLRTGGCTQTFIFVFLLQPHQHKKENKETIQICFFSCGSLKKRHGSPPVPPPILVGNQRHVNAERTQPSLPPHTPSFSFSTTTPPPFPLYLYPSLSVSFSLSLSLPSFLPSFVSTALLASCQQSPYILPNGRFCSSPPPPPPP